MKWWSFTLVSLFAISACSKNSMDPVTGDNSEIGSLSFQTKVIHTSWERGYAWSESDSAGFRVYSHQRTLSGLDPEIVQEGAVVIWAKNVPADQGGVIARPTVLPFKVLPEVGRPAYINEWYYSAREEEVTMKFRTNKHQFTDMQIPAPNGEEQFRYFLIPKEALDLWGYTPLSIRGLTYERFIALTGVEG
jgi:hypothetical protein